MLVINHVWIPALMFGVYINTSFYLNHITSDLNVNFEYFCLNWFHFILQKCRLVGTFNTLCVDQQGNFERYKITFLLSPSTIITFCLVLSTNALATLSIFFPYPIFTTFPLKNNSVRTLLHLYTSRCTERQKFKLWYDSQSASVIIWHSLGSVRGSENTSKIILNIILEQKQNLQLMSARLPRLKERIQMGFLSFWHFDICKFEVGIFYLISNGSFSIAVQSDWTSR